MATTKGRLLVRIIQAEVEEKLGEISIPLQPPGGGGLHGAFTVKTTSGRGLIPALIFQI